METLFFVKIQHLRNKIVKFVLTKILKRKYYRTGKCKCCGECCQHIYVKHGNKVITDEKTFRKLQFLHQFYTYLEVIGKDETGLIFSCTMQDPVTKKCKVHKKRPGICRRYPQEEMFLMGGTLSDKCGYKLEPIIKFNEILSDLLKKS